MKNKIKAWVKLLSVQNIGNTKAIQLAKECGEPENFIDDGNEKFWQSEIISEKLKIEILQSKAPGDWQLITELIDRYEIKFVSILDDIYPKLLKNIYDPPPFFFYRGNLDKEIFRRTIAIVGTRRASDYGKMMTRKIAKPLIKAGFTIISGLAYGIDTLAHRTAVENGGKTISVFGTSVNQIYPPENRKLAEKILENGAILSEYVPGSKSEKWNFPTRNRIISGLSLGSIIIEGKKTSGALLTSKFAMDQNRDIFALPGDINRSQAAGPNYLIQLGANLITSAQDILDYYNIKMDDQLQIFPNLTPEEDIVYQLLLQNKPNMHFDAILIKSGLTMGKISNILLSLELKSVVKKIAGNKFMPLY